MSSMRNAVQRRNHRERAQPKERQKWGLLEKPKDYKLRAADHKVKKRKIKALQQKAAERNEDEFYFGMMSAQSRGGVKVAKRGMENAGGGGKVLSGEVVKLMKTQDVGYLRTVLQQTKRERERLEKDVIAGEIGVSVERPLIDGQRLVLDGEDQTIQTAKPPSRPEHAPKANNRRLSDNYEASDEGGLLKDQELSPEAQRRRHTQVVRRRKLHTLGDRERDLSIALQEVETQQARMNGSIGGVNKKGVKFKVRQRRR